MQWGRAKMRDPENDREVGIPLKTLFPSLRTKGLPDNAAELTYEQLKELIRTEFREPVEPTAQLDEAFAALRILNEQLERRECSSQTVSGSGSTCVRVEATSGFISQNANGEFMFTYQITVTNEGDEIVQLLGRQWDILDKDGNVVASVPKNSPGVVGQTPILRPGESFQYSSGTGLPTPKGHMEGSFQMATVDLEARRHGKFFDAAVSGFRLSDAVRAGPVH